MSFTDKVIEDIYSKKGAIPGPYQPVEFDSDMIMLDIPIEGTTIKGWTITPLVRPVVSSSKHHIHPA